MSLVFIPEIIETANNTPKLEDRVTYLKQYMQYPAVKEIVFLLINKPDWDLPEGMPPYKRDENAPIGITDSTLHSHARRLYVFDKKTDIPTAKKEALFIGMLESIHFKEADLIVEVKDGTKKYKNINKKLWEALVG